MQMAIDNTLPPEPTLMDGPGLHGHNAVFRRRNPETGTLELMGHAGDNESMWTNSSQYFGRR